MTSLNGKPLWPVMHTLKQDKGNILAVIHPIAFERGFVEPHGFVSVHLTRGKLIGRITEVFDADVVADNVLLADIRRLQDALVKGEDAVPSPDIQAKTYKVARLDPIGVVNGRLEEFSGGVGSELSVYRVVEEELAQLYPAHAGGLHFGYVAVGSRATAVPFVLTASDLSRHGAIYGKNGTGKTNMLKVVALQNVTSDEPLAMLIFGHPDIGLDNPNDLGTRGLIGLNHPKVFHFGFDDPLRVGPGEVELEDVLSSYEWHPAQKSVIRRVYQLDPTNFVSVLAYYDTDADPLQLIFGTERHGKRAPVKRWGLASKQTLEVVRRNMREIARLLDEHAAPLIPRILSHLLRKETVLVNTFDLDAEQQALLVKMLLRKLQEIGKAAMKKGRARRIVVLMDEAQVFERYIGEALSSFLKESRKMGVSIFFLTQNPTSHSLSPEIKGEIHNVISFHLSPTNIRELLAMAPDLAEMEDVIRRRPIGGYMGVAVAMVRSQHFPAVVKTPRFEDICDTLWVPHDATSAALDDATGVLEATDVGVDGQNETPRQKGGWIQLDIFDATPVFQANDDGMSVETETPVSVLVEPGETEEEPFDWMTETTTLSIPTVEDDDDADRTG